MIPCSTRGCRRLANAAGWYCDECDLNGMPEGWSRTRDEAWLAYKKSPDIEAIPLPDRKARLVLVKGGRAG